MTSEQQLYLRPYCWLQSTDKDGKILPRKNVMLGEEIDFGVRLVTNMEVWFKGIGFRLRGPWDTETYKLRTNHWNYGRQRSTPQEPFWTLLRFQIPHDTYPSFRSAYVDATWNVDITAYLEGWNTSAKRWAWELPIVPRTLRVSRHPGRLPWTAWRTRY